MKELFYILFGWGLTVSVSWCLGQMLLRALHARLSRPEGLVLAFLTGSACLSLAMYGIAAAHLVHRGVLLALSVLVMAAALRMRVWRADGDPMPPVSRGWKTVFIALWLVFGAFYFIQALAPETSPDGMAYHLDFVARYEKAHGFVAITNNVYASLPEGLELLFLFAFAWGRHSAAALVHYTYLLVLPWLILNWGRRVGLPVAGAAGGLLIYLAPLTGMDGSTGYNDVALATTVFAVFALLEIWRSGLEAPLLVPIGMLAGFAFGIKYTGFMAVPYAAGVVVYTLWRARKPVLRAVLTVCVCAAVLILPPLVKNWIVVRNPFSPFFNGLFPNSYVTVQFEQQWSRYVRTYDLHSFGELIHKLTIGGFFGVVFLLAPLSVLALRSAPGRRLMLAAAAFSLPYPMNIDPRFLLPGAVFIAPGMVMGLGGGKGRFFEVFLHAFVAVPARLGRRLGKVPLRVTLGSSQIIFLLVATSAYISWPSHIQRYAPNAWHLPEKTPWRAALRLESEDDYLFSQMGADFQIMRFIERATPPGSKVYCFSSPPAAYCARELLSWYYSASNLRLWNVYWAGYDPGAQPLRILTFHFAPQALRGMRLLETEAPPSATPSVNEMRLYGPAGELAPDSSWRYDAHPFPWDAQFAFDRNPVTRWEAWQEIREGARLQVRFGNAETVSAVRVETKGDQKDVHWQLQGLTDGDQWKALPATSEIVLMPAQDFRKAATQEFKRCHIRYFLTDTPPYMEQFGEHEGQWGIRKLAQFGNQQLYFIE